MAKHTLANTVLPALDDVTLPTAEPVSNTLGTVHNSDSCYSTSHHVSAVGVATAERLMTSAVASLIASRPTSTSDRPSRPTWAAVSKFCSYIHHHQTYYLYCMLICGVPYCDINV